MSIHKVRFSIVLLIAIVVILLTPLYIPYAYAQVIPRDQTLVIGGAYWEPPKKYNPFNYGGSVSGIVGLIYEPLYLWIPIKPEEERWFPWLAAEKPKWISPTEVEIKIRPQAKWWDGRDVTAEDVRFTFYEVPRKVTTAAWAGMRHYVDDVVVVDAKTVRIKLNPETANYADFLFQLYSAPILPKHFFGDYVDRFGDELTDLAKWPVVAPDKDPTKLIASGMYKVRSVADDHFVLERVDNWWGKDVFGRLPAPKYIKGVVVYSNQVAANMLGAGELDWSCFYIPGGPDMVRRRLVVAYYDKEPYYLSANVAFLFVNTQKPPFNDARFRRAMYYAINVDKIISAAFEGVVISSNPVGLLPYWEKYLARDLLAKYDYRYDPERAKRMLDEAGYIDRDGDGWRDMPDGTPIRIRIIVPYGWTDWMFAIINIAEDLRAVGIYAEALFPDFGKYIEEIDRGIFDAAINNFGSFATPSPYSLYYWAYNATPGIWTGSHGRYYNPKLNNLIYELGRTPPHDEAKIASILRQIQEILLEEMPALPLWYNGYWFLASTKYWVGWPSEKDPYGVPTIWNGQWQHGGMLVLLNLRSAIAPTPSPTPTPTPMPTPTPTPTPVVTPATITVTVMSTITTVSTVTVEVVPWATVAVVVIVVAIVCVVATYFLTRKR